MNYLDLTNAVADANRTIRLGDEAVKKLAPMMSGRLRIAGVDKWTLEELKKELKGFNARTKMWKANP